MNQQRKRLVIFAGAGASYAIDSDKYPTTAGFVERLPKELRKDQLIAHLSANFEAKFGDKTPDVEKILWCLDEVLNYCKQPADPKSPISWLLPGNVLSGALGVNADTTAFVRLAAAAVSKIDNLRNKINAQLYEVYSETPTEASTENNWTLLFRLLLEKNYWLDVVTTNYDVVLEGVVDSNDWGIGYGLTRGAIPRLDLSKWKRLLTEEEVPYADGIITKLHGSLNWERDRNGISFCGMDFKSDHRHHVAIYPGFKGAPSQEPFSLFHDYFERALTSADAAVFIGFAFRDEYINTLLSRAYKGKRYVAIDPSDLSELPDQLRGQIDHIKLGFGKDSVEKAVSSLSS